MGLPPYLLDIQAEIEGYARGHGLEFFQVIFEILDYKRMNEVAAYGGYPTRYPHWRFGMEYEQLSKGHVYGLSRIYEMVINNDPCYAYLLEGNSLVDQKMVMAHVYAHCDFFKNNFCFSRTNRKMIDGMANHATRIRRHIERHGIERVEDFIDVCLSINDLIDPALPFAATPSTAARKDDRQEDPQGRVPKLRAKSYMDKFINPPEFIADQRRKAAEERRDTASKIPRTPQRDVLQFLLQHAPLTPWERDILEAIRDEAYYFLPQKQTKIMNEGWATYWHSKIMTEQVCSAADIIEYADHASGVLATARGQLNPYKLGVELLRHIEERWNRGQFGREWESCDDLAARKHWDRRLGLGRDKIFEVRRLYNDVTFIDEFFTEEFCRENKFFSFIFNDRSGNWEIESRAFRQVKERLLFGLTNFGDPFIRVVDGNFENRGELLLEHDHEGVDLRLDHARDTLANVARVWKRPVNLVTRVDEKGKLLRFDGNEHSERTTEEEPG